MRPVVHARDAGGPNFKSFATYEIVGSAVEIDLSVSHPDDCERRTHQTFLCSLGQHRSAEMVTLAEQAMLAGEIPASANRLDPVSIIAPNIHLGEDDPAVTPADIISSAGTGGGLSQGTTEQRLGPAGHEPTHD